MQYYMLKQDRRIEGQPSIGQRPESLNPEADLNAMGPSGLIMLETERHNGWS